MYILQSKIYALGNFINLTPTIKAIADKIGKPVPVHFETEYVKQCFLDCDFIQHIERPDEDPLFTSRLVGRANTMPDYKLAFEYFKEQFGLTTMPHTYIDTAPEKQNPEKDYVLIMNGTGSQDADYIALKDPGVEMMKFAIAQQPGKIVFTGSTEDYERAKGYIKKENAYTNDIRMSLKLIHDANFIIANDTGLAHAAGAMNKNITILWKDTMFLKNTNPGKNTKYIMKHEWEQMIIND